MQTLYIFEVPDTTREQYEAINDDAFPGGEPPEGLLHHVASDTGSGLRVTEVWESPEAFQAFQEERLGPVLGKHGVPEPEVHVEPVYRTVRG